MKRILTALMLMTLSALAACDQTRNGTSNELENMAGADRSAVSASSITVYYKADAQWVAAQGS